MMGQALGMLMYSLAKEKRRIARVNLKLCLPHIDTAHHEKLIRQHFRCLGRSILEVGAVWWGSPEQIRKTVILEGAEHIQEAKGRPIIFLAPHFVGMDMGGIRISMECNLATLYSRIKDKFVEEIIVKARTRFPPSQAFPRQNGIRPLIRALRSGTSIYYLPDQDFGRRETIFIPFFGVPAATTPGLARLANIGNAVVIPCVTRQLPAGKGYIVTLYEPWKDYPTGDLTLDTCRMNEFIENRVLEMPEQYWWLHKRFKTRPDGELDFYQGI